MRILHTADWHLNARLGRVERQPDIVARLEEIAGYLDEYRVDVMVVAGDVFGRVARLEDVRAAMSDVQGVFKPFVARGGTIVAISGNHDHEALFHVLRVAADLTAPLDPHQRGPRPPGRLYLAAQPTLLQLADAAGQTVQFALLPYPLPARYLEGEATRFASLDDRNARLHQALVQKVQKFQTLVNPRLPSVLVGHFHLRGSQVHSLYHISEREDVIFEPGELPMNWAYVALGHIHRPQALNGAEHIRYAGSIERFDYAERNDQKGVVLIEVGATELEGQPVCLPLDATPIYHLEITDPETDLADLAERYPDAARALVSYRLVYRPGEHNRDAICQELERVFPRCYRQETFAEGSLTLVGSAEATATHRDVPGTVRHYLEQHLADHPERADVLALAEALLAGGQA